MLRQGFDIRDHPRRNALPRGLGIGAQQILVIFLILLIAGVQERFVGFIDLLEKPIEHTGFLQTVGIYRVLQVLFGIREFPVTPGQQLLLSIESALLNRDIFGGEAF